MARKMHARAISMDYYVDSSDDEAILNIDDSESDDDLSTVRGGNNPHPVASFQPAFDESISDSAEQYRTGKPALELSSISAEERRKRLLMGEDYNDTYSAMWRETPASKHHPLKKIVAQITYGVHLLHVQMAVSNEEVVKILQRHIDQVDELIRRADEDLGMALADIEVRISHLKFALADRTTFDDMLEDKTYRDTIIRGNELIEDMIKRTENLVSDVVTDIVCGHDCISEMSNYMARIGSTWPMSTTDLGLYNTMVLNTEGWLECFDSLKLEGKSLNGCLMQLSALVEEMARRAENASKKTKSSKKHNVTPATQQSLKLPTFPTRQSSTSRHAKPIPSDITPQVQTPTESLTPSARLSIYTPPQAPIDAINLPLRRKTNVSERRATAISEKRSSTATIASLFIGVDDDLPPAMPELPKNRKSLKKSIKRAKVPKVVEPTTRPRELSISSVRSGDQTKAQSPGAQKDLTEESQMSQPVVKTSDLSAATFPDRNAQKHTVPTISEPVIATPSKSSTTTSSANSEQSSPGDSMKRQSSETSAPSNNPPQMTITIPELEQRSLSFDKLSAPQPSPRSASASSLSLDSPHTFLPPRPPFAESPILGYERSSSPGSVMNTARSSPAHSPSPSLVVKRKPLPGSSASSTVGTPKLQHSPQPSASFESTSQITDPVEDSVKAQLNAPKQLHKHQPSKSSLLSESSHPGTTTPETTTAAPLTHTTVPAVTENVTTERAAASPVINSVSSPVTRSSNTEPIEILVPQVQPLLDEPLIDDLAPLTTKRLHLSKMDSISSAQQVLNRLSMSSDESDESSIVPLSELAHPFRSTSPEPTKQARSDSPAEGLGIDFPISQPSALPRAAEAIGAQKQAEAAYELRKPPMMPAPVIEEESEAESEEQDSNPVLAPSQTKVTIIQTSKATVPSPTAIPPRPDSNNMPAQPNVSIDKDKPRGSTASSRDSELSSILKSYVGLTSAGSPSKNSPVKVEVYQPKTVPKAESPLKNRDPRVQAPPPMLELDTQRSGSPGPFLHSATQSTCHSASLSVSSNVNKALPAIPKDNAEFNRSPPHSPSAPSFFSSFSLGMSSEGGFDSFASKGRANRSESPQRPSSRSRTTKDSKSSGPRTMSPLGPDSANSATSSFPRDHKDDALQRPQTSRSTKPSRSKLGLFPSPSMLDLRSKGDSAFTGKPEHLDDANVGEYADSALPHLHAPPRLIPRAKDGGKSTGGGGVGTKLKKLIGFGRKSQKAIDVS